ncbi:MAG: type I restriction endonuclease [Bacteroidetes bacterium]|nr:type I restriction endonuclease [Bacteroidota bacterium]
MDFQSQIQELKQKYEDLKGSNLIEDATVDFFIRPFLGALDWDTTNHKLVKPEYEAIPDDIKGGRVDFALLSNGRPIIFLEAKKLNEPLDSHVNQIKRYFNVVREVSVAILTNGDEFWFYTDLEYAHQLDTKPFLKFKLSEIDEQTMNHLRQFSSQNFDISRIKSLAFEILSHDKIYAYLVEQFKSPDDQFVKFLSKSIFNSLRQDVRKNVEKALPSVYSKLTSIDSGDIDIIIDPDPPPQPPHNERQNIFELASATGKKINDFMFVGEVHKGNWSQMFIHVLSYLCRENASQLVSASQESRGFKVASDAHSIKLGVKSIGGGHYTSTNSSNDAKLRYLRIALSAFDMKDSLLIKFK